MNQEIKKLLTFDPLLEMEKITGKSCVESEKTIFLGFEKNLINNLNKDALLMFNFDTYFNMYYKDYINIAEKLGFEKVYEENFADINNKDLIEKYYIFFHRKYGILLSLETFRAETINTAIIYFNWKRKNKIRLTNSNDSFDDNIGISYINVIEGLKFHIEEVLENGEFITPWIKQPFLWLCNYMETKIKDYNYTVINNNKLNKLPIEIQRAISHKI